MDAAARELEYHTIDDIYNLPEDQRGRIDQWRIIYDGKIKKVIEHMSDYLFDYF